MEKIEDLDRGKLIKARIISRPNALNAKYRVGQLGLELEDIGRIKDIFLLETLEMRADLADKMIAEAESQGKNTSDPHVMRELGEEIKARGTPFHKSESIISAVWASLYLMGAYGIAIGIWGLVFKKSFLVLGLYGAIVGLLISLLFVAPVVAYQRTKEQVRDIAFAVGSLWGQLVIIIGVIGLVAFAIRLIFF